jgi:hypothetical protein
MSDESGQVTLILRAIEPRWRNEYLLNLLAAFATKSNFSHIEVAIGDTEGNEHQMTNVLRIYNDKVGVELCQRTGKSPNFKYLQIGCSKSAERAMLKFARLQQGKPFSVSAMARSVLWPRKTTHQSYFCAELVAACLQAGGLMASTSNAAAASPQSLYDMYASTAAISGNPCTMRSMSSSMIVRPALATQDIEMGLSDSTPFCSAVAALHPNRAQGRTTAKIPVMTGAPPSVQTAVWMLNANAPPPDRLGPRDSESSVRCATAQSRAEEAIRTAVRSACARQTLQEAQRTNTYRCNR